MNNEKTFFFEIFNVVVYLRFKYSRLFIGSFLYS